MNYKQILERKFPTASWTMTVATDYNTLVWTDTTYAKPTKEWLDQKIQKSRAAKEFAAIENRKHAYPHIADQLDMLWHGMNDDESKRIEPFYSAIKAIKDQFPKR
jgi:hypothetical protein